MGQLVSGYLDFAERQAEREQAVDKATGEYKKYKERTLSSVGEDYLNSQAVDKAMDEYKKYKARTLSTVEEDYLNSIKILEKKDKKQ